MTPSLFAQLYSASAIGIMLLVRLEFPFSGMRQWLQQGRYVAYSEALGWAVVTPPGTGSEDVEPVGSKWQARVAVGPFGLARSWIGAALECGWCSGAWVSLFFACVFVDGNAWDRLVWWPVLWLASAATTVVLDKVAE
jgi:hypothetical protein